MLDDALAHFEGEVQSAEVGVSNFEVLNNAQGLEVVIEEFSMLSHERIERVLACMPEGRMSDVVDQCQRLGNVDVELQGRRNRARNLRDFDGVRQPSAEMVGVAPGEDLCLILEAAECPGMDDAVAIALERVAIRMGRFR